MKRMVRVNMRKIESGQEFRKRLVPLRAFHGQFEALSREHTDNASFVCHRPTIRLSSSRTREGFAHRQRGREKLGGAPHHLGYPTLTNVGEGIGRWQVNTLLTRECRIDGLGLH